MTLLPAQFMEWLRACNERFARFSGSQFSPQELPGGPPPPRDTFRSFKCLLCGRPMQNAGKRWECRCGFFYQPLVPGSIPKKYRNDFKQIKRMCMTGRGKDLGKEKKCQTEVSGRAEYCPRCVAKRRNASRRLANTGLEPHPMANSPIGAEALTKTEMQVGYPHPKPSIFESNFSTRQRDDAARHA